MRTCVHSYMRTMCMPTYVHTCMRTHTRTHTTISADPYCHGVYCYGAYMSRWLRRPNGVWPNNRCIEVRISYFLMDDETEGRNDGRNDGRNEGRADARVSGSQDSFAGRYTFMAYTIHGRSMAMTNIVVAGIVMAGRIAKTRVHTFVGLCVHLSSACVLVRACMLARACLHVGHIHGMVPELHSYGPRSLWPIELWPVQIHGIVPEAT